MLHIYPLNNDIDRQSRLSGIKTVLVPERHEAFAWAEPVPSSCGVEAKRAKPQAFRRSRIAQAKNLYCLRIVCALSAHACRVVTSCEVWSAVKIFIVNYNQYEPTTMLLKITLLEKILILILQSDYIKPDRISFNTVFRFIRVSGYKECRMYHTPF